MTILFEVLYLLDRIYERQPSLILSQNHINLARMPLGPSIYHQSSSNQTTLHHQDPSLSITQPKNHSPQDLSSWLSSHQLRLFGAILDQKKDQIKFTIRFTLNTFFLQLPYGSLGLYGFWGLFRIRIARHLHQALQTLSLSSGRWGRHHQKHTLCETVKTGKESWGE